MVGRWSMIGHFYLKTVRAVPHRHAQETGITVRFNAFVALVVLSSRFDKKVHRFYRWFKNTSARKV